MQDVNTIYELIQFYSSYIFSLISEYDISMVDFSHKQVKESFAKKAEKFNMGICIDLYAKNIVDSFGDYNLLREGEKFDLWGFIHSLKIELERSVLEILKSSIYTFVDDPEKNPMDHYLMFHLLMQDYQDKSHPSYCSIYMSGNIPGFDLLPRFLMIYFDVRELTYEGDTPKSHFTFALKHTDSGSKIGFSRQPNLYGGLKEHEYRILVLSSRGLSNKEIAEKEGIDEDKVKNTKRQINRKLGATSSSSAVSQARIEAIIGGNDLL